MLAVGVTLVLSSAHPALAKTLPPVGKVYPIAERSALEEMKERATQIDWQKHVNAIKPERYRPGDLVSLPRAVKKKARLVDMTYSLEMDIPDGRGGILYPRGYRFNPLDYISYPRTLVFINASDKAQTKWFLSSEYAHRFDTLLLITDGSFADVIKDMRRPVYYATRRLIEKFDVRVLPSVAKQSGRQMEVREYVVKGR